ncbi:MAG: winged helix-turn-helix domain-containing protein [Acidimicrobiales bacterium]
MAHCSAELRDIVHQKVRLGIMAVLHEVHKAEFKALRDLLDLSDGNLSRHLRILEEAGLVAIEKGYQGRRPRTWARATPRGEAAFEAELAVLRDLVRQAEDLGSTADAAEHPEGPTPVRSLPPVRKVGPAEVPAWER